MDRRRLIENPYRPGAGHLPPLMAGRAKEVEIFRRLLRQRSVLENIVITGLRGFGKTVLLETMRDLAICEGWLWIGNDLSESAALSEERLAMRILTDTAASLSQHAATKAQTASPVEPSEDIPSTFDALKMAYEKAPGLPSDRLRSVLTRLSGLVGRLRLEGIIFAYDEAQCLSDHAERDQFPMSMLIETLSAMQKRDSVTPCLLLLSGLPQLFSSLTETRTYTERMFHVMTLDRLSRQETFEAINTPIRALSPPLHVTSELVDKAVELSGGYPYLIQFFGRELVDQLLQNGGVLRADDYPSTDAMARLDNSLFGARWNKTSERQREFLWVVANRPQPGKDFAAQEIADVSNGLLTNAQATQILQSLCDRGLVYRVRHGRYAFTVPLSESMITRRFNAETVGADGWGEKPEPTKVDAGNSDLIPARGVPRKKGWRWFA